MQDFHSDLVSLLHHDFQEAWVVWMGVRGVRLESDVDWRLGGLWVGVAGCRGSDRSSLLSPTAVWAGLMAYDFSLMACWKLWADSMSGRTFR